MVYPCFATLPAWLMMLCSGTLKVCPLIHLSCLCLRYKAHSPISTYTAFTGEAFKASQHNSNAWLWEASNFLNSVLRAQEALPYIIHLLQSFLTHTLFYKPHKLPFSFWLTFAYMSYVSEAIEAPLEQKYWSCFKKILYVFIETSVKIFLENCICMTIPQPPSLLFETLFE